MQQQPLSLEQQAQEKAAYRAIFAKRQTSNGGFDADRMEISALDVDAVERTATFERLWRAGGLRFWYNNFSDLLTDERANHFAYDFWRDRVRARIADPSLHEALEIGRATVWTPVTHAPIVCRPTLLTKKHTR